MPDIHPYWADPDHAGWRWHYGEDYGGRYLLFSENFKKSKMPGDMAEINYAEPLLFTILDKQTDRIYTCTHTVAYEHAGHRLTTQDADWNDVEAESLQAYFYGCHFCGCHVAHHIYYHNDQRITGYHDVELTDGEKCPHNRFRIVSCVYEKMPDLILMSETMSKDELEARLAQLAGAPVMSS